MLKTRLNAPWFLLLAWPLVAVVMSIRVKQQQGRLRRRVGLAWPLTPAYSPGEEGDVLRKE
jgi:hypothetical protein